MWSAATVSDSTGVEHSVLSGRRLQHHQGSVGLCCFVERLRFYFLQNLRLELYSFFLVLLIDARLWYIEIPFAFGQVV